MSSAHHQSPFRYQLFALCVAFAQVLHAAPIPNGLPTPLTVSTGLPTAGPASSSTAALVTSSDLWPSPLLLTDPSPSPSPSSTSAISSPVNIVSTDTELVTVTATRTADPVTITQTLLFTSTVTDSTTLSLSPSPTTVTSTITSVSSVVTSITSASTATPTSSMASWEVPSDFAGNVTEALGSRRWSWGAKNVKLVDSIPASAWAAPSATPSSSTNEAANSPPVDLSNGPAMQVSFPKGSINPANKKAPVGGVGLYISPLDLSKATNVSLEYSVFFPADFDFVKGGKLPGMYGGHKGCSGGQQSEDCFSTRLMFRTGGKGELYLYIPKNVQTEALCNTPPLSYCDSSYGYSIGRGAWTFERGAWSNIRQEIRLNTPGIADGGFRIFVNNKLVLSSDVVLFRADLAPASPTASTPASPFSTLPGAPPQASETSDPAPEATPSTGNEDEGLLGGLLGGLAQDLGSIVKRSDTSATTTSVDQIFRTMPIVTETVTTRPTSTVFATSTVTASPSTQSATPPPLAQAGLLGQVTGELPGLEDSQLVSAVTDALPLLGNGSILAPQKPPTDKDDNANFQGIMFNTFFGGNDPSWASPVEQEIWFNRISLSVLA
ncbi:hypothetical protein JCM16303_002892 [Sporobolomyces ruberrimus]